MLGELNINWLLVGVILVIVIGFIIGFVKGAFKMIYAVVAIVLAITLTIMISPITKSFLMRNTKFYNFIYEKTETLVDKNEWTALIAKRIAPDEKDIEIESGGADSVSLMRELLDTLGIPEKFKEAILGDESVITSIEISSDADTNDALEAMEKGAYTGITHVVIKAIAFLLTLLVVGIILAILGGLMSALGRVPGIDKVNAIVGGLAGGCIALLIVWVFFAIVTMLSTTEFGKTMLAMISENPLLSFIYNHNVISARILS